MSTYRTGWRGALVAGAVTVMALVGAACSSTGPKPAEAGSSSEAADHDRSSNRSTTTATTGEGTQAPQPPLKTDIFMPARPAIFSTPSTLVLGRDEAILIDAQFSAADARQLAERIRASGRKLSIIYISHPRPEYHFGLDTLKTAFPEARVLATPQTVAAIRASKDVDLKAWGPQLGSNAPRQVIVPEALEGDRLKLDRQTIRIIGLDGPDPTRTTVWIPSIRMVTGGALVTAGEHVWMADTRSARSRQHWLEMLVRIRELEPDTVIPGHHAPGSALDLGAVQFTADYVRAFEEEIGRTRNASALADAMKERFPDLQGNGTLDISARVAKGEMAWP